MKIRSHRQLPVILLLLVSPSIFGATSSPSPLLTPTLIGAELIQSLAGTRFAYFNLSQKQATPAAPGLIAAALGRGELTILDQTENRGTETIDRITTAINGIKLSKPLLIINTEPDGSLHYTPLDLIRAADIARIAGALREKSGTTRKKRNAGEPYHVGKTVYITLSHRNLTCPLAWGIRKVAYGLGSRIESYGSYDACFGAASFSTQLRLDFLPSIGDSHNGALPAGKILRVSGQRGGGWHIADRQLNVNGKPISGKRTTWFGPYVDAYEASLTLDDDSAEVIDHSPHNVSQTTEINQSSGVTVGQGFSATLGVGSSGPTLGLSHNAQSTHTSNLAVKYTIGEYQAINSTSGDRFKITWRRSSPPLVMRGNADILSGALPVNDALFSGVSHANFVPGFSVTYRAPFTQTGESTLKLRSTANVMAAMGHVSTANPVDTYMSSNLIQLDDRITIDWDSPYFRPEVPVELKADRPTGSYCLTMTGENHEVLGTRCDQSGAQRWGLTAWQNYVSFKNPGLCLTVQPQPDRAESRLIAARCERSALQQWEWRGNDKNRLVNPARAESVTIAGTSTDENSVIVRGTASPDPTLWTATIRQLE